MMSMSANAAVSLSNQQDTDILHCGCLSILMRWIAAKAVIDRRENLGK